MRKLYRKDTGSRCVPSISNTSMPSTSHSVATRLRQRATPTIARLRSMLLIGLFLGCSHLAFAGSGIFDAYAILNVSGGGNTFYDLKTATVNPDFQGANFGSFNGLTGSLLLKGGQVKTFKNGSDNICSGKIWYSIYPATGSPVVWNTIILPFSCQFPTAGCGSNSGDQVWEIQSASVNLLAGLANGNYKVAVYVTDTGDAAGGCASDPFHTENNGGANWVADFSVTGSNVLINSNQDGGFEQGTTFAANGWTVVNTAVANGSQWFTTPTSLTQGSYTFAPTGTRAAYVSNNAGANWRYNTSGASGSSHIYKDVTFPSGNNLNQLSFRWNANGEASWDVLYVYLCPQTLTPVANSPSSSTSTVSWTGTGTATLLGTFQLLSAGAGQTGNISISSVVAGNAVANSNMRLVFTWKNDASGGVEPPAALDDVSLISGTCLTAPVTGTKSVGPGGDYATLTAAVNAINSFGVSGAVLLELNATYTSASESFPITLSNSSGCMSATNTVTIRPATGVTSRTITSANTTATIDINGGIYWTIDGRAGGVGASQLTVSNTSTATGGTAVRFINEANNNTVRYTTLTALYASTASGVVNFSNTTGANGNDSNTIDNCSIDGGAGATASPTAAAQNGIYSSGSTGTTAANNSNNTISNCSIFNCFMPASASNGINLSAGSTDWTISGNSIYQTSSRTTTTSSVYTGIIISSGGNNFSVTGNFIGGSAASASGTTTINGTVASRYRGISLSVGTTTASSIQGNTIDGWSVQSSSGASGTPGVFAGIYLTGTGSNANIGTVTGNTIGAGTGTGRITVSSSSSGGTSYGIAVDASSTVSTISNNVIGAFTTVGTTTSISHSFAGIATTAGTTLTINNNTIGSTATANSINASTASTNATAQTITGILNSSSATISITNNTIANLTNAYVPSAANTNSINRGILASSGTVTITGNTIRNMSTAAQATGTGSSASVIGISMTSTTAPAVVSQNVIHSLSNTHATAATLVTGIHYAGPTTGAANEVARNFIHSLVIASSSASADLRGIQYASGLATVKNNMIRLGIDASGAALTNNILITGLYDATSTTGTGMYHNSVYIGGAGVTTGAASTHAFRSDQTANTRTYQDNIFVNTRSNGTGTGKHYAVRVAGTGVNPAGLALNYNVYQATGTGAVFGFYNTDVANLPAWQTAVGQDANSFNSDPKFLTPDGTSATVDLHINPSSTTVIEGNGLAIAGVTDDYDGQTRSGLTPTDIGADAGNFTGVDLTAPAIAYTPLANTCTPGATTLTATITDASGVPTTGVGLPVLYWKLNAGAYTAATGTFVSGNNYSFTFGAGSVAGDLVSYYIAAQDNAGTPNVSVFPSTGASGLTANPPAAATPPTTPSSFTILTALSGTYTVGSGGNYATLTAAVTAYNNSCLAGPVVFSLTDATYTTPAETFPITINSNAFASATNTLTIKPATGISPTITGTPTFTLIKIQGADYVIIDGSNGNMVNTTCPSVLATRDLTIANTNSAASAIIWLGSNGAANGATNNSIKNTNLAGGASSLITFGIFSGSATAPSPGTVADAPNSNNAIENCSFKTIINGISTQGVASNASLDQNWVIRNNTFGSAVAAEKLTGLALVVANAQNFSIDNNTVAGVASSTASTSLVSGIQLRGLLNGGNVYQNKISDIKQRNTSGYGANGIYLNATSTAANVNIYNNFIWDIAGAGFSTAGENDNGYGIMVTAGGGFNIDYNTVVMNTNQTSATGVPAAINIGSSVTTAGSLKIRNNLFINTQSAGNTQRYTIYSSAANTVFSEINYNDYYTTGPNLGFIGSSRATVANIQTGFGGNLNSVSISPTFTSSTDYHLVPASNLALNALGAPIAGITTDIDCATRDVATPDMGADEFTPPPCTGAVGGTATGSTAFCVSGTPVISASGYSTGIGSTYQWISSTNAGDYPASGTSVAGQTNPATLTTGIVSATTYYWLRVTCPSGTATDNSTLVTVTINPSAAVISGPASKCSGDPAIMLMETGGTGTSWSWAPGGATTQSISVNPAVTTTYTVTVTSPGACVSTTTYTVTVLASPTATAMASPTTLCAGQPLNLTSTGTVAGPFYALATIPYAPTTDPGGASLLTAADDVISGAQTIPFTFNFYGTNYTTLSVASNGFIQLGTSSGSTSVYAQALPSATAPNTVIAGVWSDLNVTGAAAVRAYTTGVVGSRIYTVHYNNVPFYSSVTTSTGNLDFFIQLYEATNVIEVHVGEVTGVSTSTSNKTLGVENSTGTAAVTPVGRNAANWNVATTAKEAYRFTPNTIVSYSWTGPNTYTAATQNPTIPSAIVGNSGVYTVQVTDVAGCSATATTAAVTVNPIPATPTITPGSPTTFCAGGSVVLTSSASSGNQWYQNSVLIPGGTNTTYTATASGDYTVVQTLLSCPSLPSTATTVTVNPTPSTPTITPGGPTTFCAGGSVVLTSSASSGNQWYQNSVLIPGETNTTYTATASGDYTVVQTLLGCPSLPSTATTVTVNSTPSAPTITPGGPTTFCAGGSVLLTSSAGSGNQWYQNGGLIPGETNTTYTATASGDYTVVQTLLGCPSLPSTATTVTVNPTPSTPTITPGGPTTFCTGGSVVLTSSAGSGNQWYQNSVLIPGETNTTYTATASGDYTVVQTLLGCPSLPSTATTVTVNPTPSAPTITPGGPNTFCAGGSVLLTSSAGSGNQWYQNGGLIPGETNTTYTATASGDYTVVQTLLGCPSLPSTATSVTVNPTPSTPTITPGGPTTLCTGGNVVLTSSASIGNQWYQNGVPIPDETNQTYTATASGDYTVVQTLLGCPSLPSAPTTVTVNPSPDATITVPPSVCANAAVNAASVPDAGTGATYVWMITNGIITAGDGTPDIQYTAGSSGSVTLSVTVTNNNTCAASDSKIVTINPRPTLVVSGGGTVCTGDPLPDVTFTFTGVLPASLYYNDGVNFFNFAEITVGNSYIITNAAPGTYAADAFIDGNFCEATDLGGSVTVAVTAQPTIAEAGIDQTGAATCGLTQVTLAANTPSVGTGAWSIINGTGGSFGDASSATSTFSGTAGTTYTLRWTISNAQCTSFDEVDVTFNQNPTPAAAGPDQTSSATCGLTQVTLAANTPSIGTGAWSIVSGVGGSFGNASSASSTFSGTAGTTYRLRWTISNAPCTASFDEVDVTFNQNPTPAAAGPDQTGAATCGLTQVMLAANTPSIGTGAWSIVSGVGGSFGNAGSASSTFSGTAGTTYRLRWTISNAPCTASFDEVDVTFNQNPTPAAAGPDQTSSATCGLTQVTLAANTPSIGTGAWSIVSGVGGSFGNAGSATSTFSGTAGTTYTLRWTISNAPCTASFDEVDVTFNQNMTPAAAGPDQTGAATCGLTQVTLAANTPSIGTGAWSIVSGAGGSLGNAGSASSTFSGTAGTTYTLRWTISNAPCTASFDEVDVTFNQNPTPAAAGSDQTGAATCGLTQVTLAANTPSIGTGAWSIVSGVGGSFGNAGSAFSTFSGTAGTTYTLRWTISNAPCTASFDEVDVTFNQNPTPAAAGPDQTSSATCGLTQVTLAANTPSIGTGAWSIVSGVGGSLGNAGSASSTFSGTAGTTYRLRWTISNAPCTASFDEVDVTFNQNPTPAAAGSDQIGAATCGLTQVTLAANTPSIGTGAWSIVSGVGGSFGNAGSASSTFSGTAGTTYRLRWTISNAPCTASFDEVDVTFNQNPTPAAAGPDQTGAATCGLTQVTLAANTPSIGTGAWSIVSGAGGSFGNAGSASSTFSGTAGTTYRLRWTISNAPCTASFDEVDVTFNQNPTPAAAGPDQTSSATCGLTQVTLAANTPSVGTGAWSIVSGVGGSFGNAGSASSTFSGTAGTTYRLRWTISNAPCTASFDEVDVTFNQNPTPAAAGSDQIGAATCGLTQVTLAANTPSIGTGAWSIVSGVGGSFGNAGSASSTFSGTAGTTYTLRWTISNAPCTASFDEVDVRFNQNPTAYAGLDQMLCPGIAATLAATAGNGTGVWSVVSGPSTSNAQFNNTSLATASFTPAAGNGTYILRWTVSNSLCTAVFDEVSIVVGTCQATFTGRIIWKQDNTSGVKDVTVALTGDQTASVVTPISGNYSITVPPGANFMITPTKALNKLNGVNAQDVFRIQQHLSSNPITDPYQLVAADVNSNNVISALDANIIQLALLGNPQASAQFVNSWRFVPTAHVMTNPPWGFPEKITLTGVSGNQTGKDFYGIKVGDVVALYANPANLTPPPPFVLTAPDKVLESGDELVIDFRSGETNDLAAFQFGLHFDTQRLELVAVEALSTLPMTQDNFGTYQLDAGILNVLWAGTASTDLPEAAPVFRLKFKVLSSGGQLSEALQLNDEFLPARAYKHNSAESAVILQYLGVSGTNNPGLAEPRLQLLQNQPNPFSTRTQIGFELPAACAAQLRIFDASGRVIALRNNQYAAGLHSEVFELAGVSGVLYYELTTPFGVLSKKMVVVRD